MISRNYKGWIITEYYDSEEEKVTLLSFVLGYNSHIIHYINNF
jgi:hypothetical protein